MSQPETICPSVSSSVIHWRQVPAAPALGDLAVCNPQVLESAAGVQSAHLDTGERAGESPARIYGDRFALDERIGNVTGRSEKVARRDDR